MAQIQFKGKTFVQNHHLLVKYHELIPVKSNLKDNAKTDYIRKVFGICTRQAESRNWNELGLQMKDKVLRFEVLSEDEWEAKLNEIMLE
jgi:hypothetical protein